MPREIDCDNCNGHGLLPITLSGELTSKPDRKCPHCGGWLNIILESAE